MTSGKYLDSVGTERGHGTILEIRDRKIIYRYDAEEVWIEAWGRDALRVRATKERQMPKENWALREPEGHHDTEQADEPRSLRGNGKADGSASEVQTVYTEKGAQITNGRIWAKITRLGKITVYHRDGRILLEEYCRNRRDLLDPKCSAIEVEARELRPTPGGDYHLTMRFESQDPEEKIYGMGQYQQPYLNLKGLDLELAHRNSQEGLFHKGPGLLGGSRGFAGSD